MKIKASGRSALILSAGLLVCLAGPSKAVENTDNTTASSTSQNAAGAPMALKKFTKPTSRQAHRKSSKTPAKSDTNKADATEAADKSSDNSSAPSAIPSSIANANAQQLATDTPTGDAAKAMSARANEIVQNPPDKPADAQPAADTGVVSADQLNDVDRALQVAPTPPAPTLTLASVQTPAAPAAPVAAASNTESSTLEQTSLIGKIFIGFGALLTMASAARMFMA